MRIKVGFFTATHPEIDKELKKSFACNVVLWEHTYNAPDIATACLKAKQNVNIELLKRGYEIRWGKPVSVSYTTQIMSKTKRVTQTWMRSFMDIKFSDLERIQRDDLTAGEIMVQRRNK